MTTPTNAWHTPARLETLLEQSKQWHSIYRPEFFRLGREEDQVRLGHLLESGTQMLVSDQLQGQLGELIKARRPRRTYSQADLNQEVGAWLAERPPAHYGVWVYYPWSGWLVHLLDEREFIELRTTRNLYKITAAEREVLAQKKIGIMGLSVGQSIALTVAMERSFGEIRLADFDLLELSNLNRIRSGVHTLGISKVVVAAREIAEIDPFLRVTCFLEGVNEENLDQFLLEGGRLDVLVDECDGLDMKILARCRARALGIPVVMDTSDRGLLDVERFDLEPERPILHGLIPDLDPRQLQGLSNEDKVPYILPMLGVETLSTRAKASLVEIGQSIATWPQLASSVVLGGAVGADVCRRIVLGHYHESGRYFVDLERLIGDRQPGGEAGGSVDTPVQMLLPAHQEFLSHDQMPALIEQVPPLQTDGRIVLERQRIVELIEAAILAPSGGNCQPWQWAYRDGTVFLFHDRGRSASLLDYEQTGSFVALGAACENLALQAGSVGLEACIRGFPLEQDTRLAAAIDFLPGQAGSYRQEELAQAIPSRHTNRKTGARKPLPHGVLSRLGAAAQSIPGATFFSLEAEGELGEMAELAGAAERLLLLHRQSHDDMMHEIRWSKSETEQSRDGIDLETLELSPTDRAALLVCRDWSALDLVWQWKGGRALEKMARRSIAAASGVALIAMPGHRPLDYFRGGRSMQRAWLTATRLHIAFQPVTSLVYLFARLVRGNGVDLPDETVDELRALRGRYCQLFAVDDQVREVLLFRLSPAEAPSARSLRRPVNEVLRFDESRR
jgi:molybdopterin/thiamine biosynthesis adenylyltransferase